MTDRITIHKNRTISGTVRSLPSSKSLSNRALIINALTKGQSVLENLSEARDTRLMQGLLHTPVEVVDVQDAGTVMRFLTAYFALTGKAKTLTGTERMKQRPIKDLVEALQALGSQIDYAGVSGFPPVRIRGFRDQLTDEVTLRGDVSSQFISALMMLGPSLPRGLSIHLKGKVASRPYLSMTAALMTKFGVQPDVGPALIRVPPGAYKPVAYRVEPDWSSASYWFAVAALAEKADILIPGMVSPSLQGDRVIVEIMQKLGVVSHFDYEGLRLRTSRERTSKLAQDFSDCPDLAQTILPVCAALGVVGEFTGLESLRIKETDRIAALEKELAKVGATFNEERGTWRLLPGKGLKGLEKVSINTYHDHRMAMGFASWATLADVEIDNPDVVQKSYPGFWDDFTGAGFRIS